MTVLNKAAISSPSLPKETAEVASLGGEVVVRGLKLSERLSMSMVVVSREERFRMVPCLLALTVLDAAGEPIFTEDQWEQFGSQHLD